MNNHTTHESPIKLCECGCGRPAPIAKQNNRKDGYTKGQPVRFIKGHGNTRVSATVIPAGFVSPQGTRAIPLTRGLVAIVDECHYEWLNQWNWWANKGSTTFYAARSERLLSGKRIVILMHRLIMNAPEGAEIDHKDGDGCNNTMDNLRIATKGQNCRNQRTRATNTSGYKGVSWHKQRKKWTAYINVNGKRTNLGLHDTAEQAARAYDAAALVLHGEFARLNFE